MTPIPITTLGISLLLAACAMEPGAAVPQEVADRAGETGPTRIRIAVFNIRELSTKKLTTVDAGGRGIDPQARAAATIIQRVQPDVLVIDEIDHDYESDDPDLALNARRFATAYLATGQQPLHLGFAFAAANNTGILSSVDLDGDGHVATAADVGKQAHGNDSFGFGLYPGQYSMAVLSRYPVAREVVRSWRQFLWRDLPGNHIPPGYYSEQALAVFRLSSKSHQDVPLQIGDRHLHLLISHPTPPVFDGDEDHNGRRNFDEIKLWVEILDATGSAADDDGNADGLPAGEPFVLAGDMNARPDATESLYDSRSAISQLLQHPRVHDTADVAVSSGAPAGRATATTAFRGQGARIDYVLPSRDLEVLGGGVFWPADDVDPEGSRLAQQASDHRLVWIDIAWPPAAKR